ncbi:hypothetical protein CP8484711_1238A, partial [Chlamydia psittaci 84-8471/1]
MSFNVTNKLE